MINNLKNIEAEKSLLGCLLSDGKLFPKVALKIRTGDFYDEYHNLIYKAISSLDSIDIVTVSDYLDKSGNLDKIGGSSYLASLISSVGSTSSAEHYADIVADYALRRWMFNILETKRLELETKTGKELVSEITLSLINKNTVDDETGDIRSIIREYEKYQKKNADLFASGRKYLGVPSGFKEIDEASSGMQAPNVYLWNAYTGVGKSWLALNIANNVLSEGYRVVFFSLEMGNNSTIGRLLSLRSGINARKLATGETMNDMKEMEHKAKLSESKLVIFRNKRYLDEILFSMMAEHAKEPVDLFIIDYVQHIKNKKSKSRYETYTDSSNDLQDMAVRLDVPILELSQIDNASARTKETKVINSKGSGDIASDAQFVVLMQDDEERSMAYKDGFKAVNFIIQKNTHGERTGKFEMIFDKRDGRFHEADKYHLISN